MLTGIIITLIVGGVSGWLAGILMHAEGSILRNIIVGLVGGVIGSIVLGLIGIHGSGLIGGIIVSVIGACILIWGMRKLGK